MTQTTTDRPQTNTWDAKSVRQALAHAFKVLNATTGPVGHKRLKSGAPEYLHTAADINEQLHMELNARRRGETTLAKRKQAMIKPNSKEISRSEMILLGKDGRKPWLRLAAAYPDHQRVLIAAVQGEAKNKSGRWVAKNWLNDMPESTYRSHRDHAAATIAKQLNAKGIERW